MSQVKSLKDTLDNANVTYKRCKLSLSRALPQEHQPLQSICSTRSLKLKVMALEDALNALNTAHTSWVSKAELPSEDLAAHAFSHAWLENEWLEVDTLIDQAGDLIHTVEEPTIAPLQVNQQAQILEEQMKSMRLGITNKIELLEDKVETSLPAGSHLTYMQMSSALRTQLIGPYRELSQRIMDGSGSTLQAVITEHEEFYQLLENRILGVEDKLAQQGSSPSPTNQPQPPISSSRTRSIEMKKSEPPSFSGRTI